MAVKLGPSERFFVDVGSCGEQLRNNLRVPVLCSGAESLVMVCMDVSSLVKQHPYHFTMPVKSCRAER